jgi:hypothetical protein
VQIATFPSSMPAIFEAPPEIPPKPLERQLTRRRSGLSIRRLGCSR